MPVTAATFSTAWRGLPKQSQARPAIAPLSFSAAGHLVWARALMQKAQNWKPSIVNGNRRSVKQLPTAIGIWLLSFIVCAVTVILSFDHADLAIASYHPDLATHLITLGDNFGSGIILSGEAIVLACLAVARLICGCLPPVAEALALACLASICAYAVDSEVLKVYFGVPNPYQTLRGAKHTLNLWEGSPYSSFPSGHMALSGAFAGVFMRLYRTSVWALSLALMFLCILLTIGGWHFLSDVIAGTYFGVSAGLIGAEALVLLSESGNRNKSN